MTYVFKESTISGRYRVCPTHQRYEIEIAERNLMNEKSKRKVSSHHLSHRVLFTSQGIQRILVELQVKVDQEDSDLAITIKKTDNLLETKITELNSLLKEYLLKKNSERIFSSEDS